MSWLTEGLEGIQNAVKDYQRDVNRSGPVGDFFTNTGGSITDAYKTAPGSMELKRTFFDPQRDSAYNSLLRQTMGTAKLASGENPFLQQAGDVEYNQNMAKRAAIVAAAIGGAAALGGGAAASGAGSAGAATAPAATSAAAPLATTGASTTTGGASVAPTTAYGVGAGNTSGLGVGLGGNYAAGSAASTGVGTGGAATYGLGEGGASLAASSPMTTGGMYYTAGLGGSNLGMQAGMGGMPGAGAANPSTSSWMPYAQAGGSILSTLFSGLLQMERDREQNVQNIRAKQAEANLKRAELQNSALDRLMRVWGR